MEIFYVGIIGFLFILAIFDLMVGVSNDAVNFLGSAVGAKVASFRTIITVAAIGVLCGALFSNGMMEIARHGIYRPEHFGFIEILTICLAVMVTDVVLLDHLITRVRRAIDTGDYSKSEELNETGAMLRAQIQTLRTTQIFRIHDEQSDLKVSLVYLSLLSESQELLASVMKLLRASNRFQN